MKEFNLENYGKFIRKQKCNLNSVKGITLIALIVTIIVLLILSGVTISSLSGKNGILTAALKAAEDTKIAEEKEIIARTYIDAKIKDAKDFSVNGEKFAESLQGQKGNRDVTSKEDGEYIIVSFNDTKRNYYVDKDGNIKENKDERIDETVEPTKDTDPKTIAGEGTKENPYLIQSIEDLVVLSNMVSPKLGAEYGKTYDNFEGKYFKLDANLDFKDPKLYVAADSKEFGDINGDNIIDTIIDELQKSSGYRPIGKDSYTFNGNIDGNGKFIINMLLAGGNTYSETGFIGCASGENSKISNLKLLDVNISTTNGKIGGLVATTTAKKLIIENCEITGKITNNGSWYPGGILGCNSNWGYSEICDISLTNNISNVDIENKNSNSTGGIVGKLHYANLDITNCMNTGNIVGGQDAFGGMIGNYEGNNSKLNMRNCLNQGNISTERNTGGMIGNLNNFKEASIKNCKNAGNISIKGDYGGGMIGNLYEGTAKLTVENCSNDGNVISDGSNANYIGGIIGNSSAKVEIKNCYNTGIISGKQYCAGITSLFNNNNYIYNCHNTGKINGGTQNAGGILSRSSTGTIVEKCYNTGDIICNRNTGGIVADSSGSSMIKKCYNKGNIKGDIERIGGISGQFTGEIMQCYNEGNVSGEENIGGILGYSNLASIKNCYNVSDISGKKSTAGIVGYANKSVVNCYNKGQINIETETGGGIVGYCSLSNSDVINNNFNLGKIMANNGADKIGAVTGGYGAMNIGDNNYYVASTYLLGAGDNTANAKIIRLENEEDIYNKMKNALTEAEGWVVPENSNIPIINMSI